MINSNNKREFRVAKIIARSGFCSRRKAESLILEKKVRINGNLIDSPALNISLNDKVTINGNLIPDIKPTEVYLYHKPIGLIVSRNDEKNRPTIFSDLPKFMNGMFSVGRLDKNTSGLLLITNDGELSRYLEYPKNSIKRTYLVNVDNNISEKKLQLIRSGISIDNFHYKKIDISRINSKKEIIYKMELSEGKNREIRKIISFLGIKIIKLERISYGPFKLGKLTPSEYKKSNIDIAEFLK